MKNRIATKLTLSALIGVGASNVFAGPTLLALRSESGTPIYHGSTTQTLETTFGTNLMALAFTGTTAYDFYSPPLLAPASLANSDKGAGVIYMQNTGTAPTNDFKVTSVMQYFDYDPATGTETLIVSSGVTGQQNVHHGTTAHWNLPNGDLPASYTVPIGHQLHISVGITLASGNPGNFGQLLYNGANGSTTLSQIPQNRNTVVWAFAPPSPPVCPSLCLTPQADGNLRLTGTAVPGQTYLIQATTSLTTPQWTTIATNTAGTDGLFSLILIDMTNYPCRFYRTSNP